MPLSSFVLQQLFRAKPLEALREQADHPREHLRRSLGAFHLTMFGIGAIIGAGIFSTIGTAAAGNLAAGRPAAGPALVASILLVALACGFTALAYAELASMIPVSGSAYTYAYATMGELAAWVIGWDLVLEYAVSNVAVAISWGDYCRSFLAGTLGLRIPGWLAMDPRSALKLLDHVPPMGLERKLAVLAQAKAGLADGAAVFQHWEDLRSAPTLHGFPVTFNLLAVLITVAVTWLVYLGIRESARANAVMVVVKLAILGVVVLVGSFFIHPGNWHPFAPRGFQGIQAGAAIIFFAFIGFDAVSTTAEECRDPGRDLPRGILLSLLVCTLVYAATTLVVTGMVHYSHLAGEADPLAFIFLHHGLGGLAALISFGAVVATTASLLVYQVAQPRIFLAMSRDGLLGPWFGRISPRHGTPANATLLTGALVALPAALLNIDEAVELTNIGTLFAFALVGLAVLILRWRRPDAPRRFRMPWVWVLAPAGVLSCGWVAWGLPRITWIRFLVWLGIGLVVYFAYGHRRSRLRAEPPP
ncbi:MAG: amino acid permease [Holophaga sp.]|jgi:APA family basic amino acid/polyamine antiporter